MSDNKEMQDGRDRAQIDSNSDYELDYVAEKHGVTRDRVRDAIQAVGNNRVDVEAYLKR